MTRLTALMQREWLQHRFGWFLLAAVPLSLSVLLLAFARNAIADSELGAAGALPAMLAAASIAGTAAVMFVLAWFSSLIIVSGLARRDHADRSIEFWLSVPVSHSASLGVPLFVHLIIVPAAAIAVGLLGGGVISALLVSRFGGGFGAWLSVPWAQVLPASLAVALRLLAGLPLATLWLAPLVLLVVLLTAWFRRWGWVVLAVGLGLGGWLLKQVFGQPLLNEVTVQLLRHARMALVNGRQGGFHFDNASQAPQVLQAIPAWALHDFGAALQDLASPLLAGGLLFAAGCFALLVHWRQRGAGAAG
ncbi:MAG: hypothetical protein Q8K96_16255 [Rubrivivax sp.]|nr:hypothetical protein [Rubrivivax sp.]